ncbi:MAG: class I SAM-dependent methyltransferase [Sulfurimonas sp.]|uniref:class I SAM-dependent methyltransferase n=1 Tax=Sulfurimonas sp. TaxID=2022749 RepID=UPI00260A38C0|nr:class I SAM-dependent methyltransferase [Sulfurimonas sp.]MDD5400646.1 class I SAM-dependent methyltransferase [Sulfurimonas sp.]
MQNKIPKEIHQERLKMHHANMEKRKIYLSKNTDGFKEELLEERTCPTCKTEYEQFLFFKDGGRYVKCQECKMIYLNPVFKDEHLENHYRNNHDFQSEIVSNDSEFYTKLYSKGLRAIEKVTEKGNILDIGCSAGGFLDIAKKNDFKTFGVELNEKEAAYAKSKGHTIYNNLLSNIKLDVKMDAITLWDVFEHLKDGEIYLNEMRPLLSENGVIFLQIPSADSLAAKMLQEKCNMFDGIEHVNLYSFKAIEKLVSKCGFSIESFETVISEIGVMNNYLNYDDPYFGDTTNTKTIFGFDEEWLHGQKMGYKMQLVLKKKS